MRIRKRFHNPLPPPDLSSPPPLSTAAAAAAVAPSVAAAAGSKEGEATAGAAAAAGLACGSSSRSEGCGLHPNGDLAAFHWCTTKLPTSRLPFHPPSSEAAAAEREEKRNISPPGTCLPTGDVPLGDGWEVLKREKDDGEDGGEGGAYRRWNAGVHSGDAGAAVPKWSGAEVSKLSLGHGGYKTLPDGTTPAEARAKMSDEEKGFTLKKRGGCYRARPGTKLGGEDDKGNADAEREVVKPRLSKIRGGATTSIAVAGTALITAVSDINGGAPAAAVAGAPKNCENAAVKEEGGYVPSAAGALMADGNRGGGNGKKRRSPAVLMEGSRCSRVNGRGWRCYQQTLVGYSLCEHHLGKGRLRSVSSVRCNGRAKKKEEADGAALSLPPSPLQQQDEEEIKPRKGRNKIGMVKARSISSLLNQAHYSTRADDSTGVGSAGATSVTSGNRRSNSCRCTS